MKCFLLASYLFLSTLLVAQKFPDIVEKTKDMKRQEGFVNYYWEDATGKIWLEFKQNNQEILYQQSLPSGLGSNDIGLDRGLLGDTRVVKFSRVGRKLRTPDLGQTRVIPFYK